MTIVDTMPVIHPAIARTNREDAGDYRGLVVELNPAWRVVECGARIQWILQRRRGGLERVGGRWASVAYHRGRETLIVAVTRRCGEIQLHATAALRALPEWIEGDAR